MVLKISTISKSTGYWIVPSIFIYFPQFASKNFRAARKEKIVDFFLFARGGTDM